MERTLPTEKSTPTISHVGPDDLLIELVYNQIDGGTKLAVATPGREPCIEASWVLPTGERLVPYSATNNLIRTGCVLLPSGLGEASTKAELLVDLKIYLSRYVDLSPTFTDIAAHYVLLTWVYDAFNELPYLRFRGDFGTGKTRALLTIGSVCYKPFFASGASTVSPIFHVLDAFAGTLVLDEADFRFSDATADLTKILNNGNSRGLPVLRTMANRHRELNPTAFRVFGPKLIGMRQNFSDQGLESRFLTEETGGRPLPPRIPISLPNSLGIDAVALRNRLLSWRFANRKAVGLRPEHLISGLTPRSNQTAAALLSLVDDDALRDRIATMLADEETRVLEERGSSTEATVLQALIDAFADCQSTGVRIADLAARLSRNTLEEFQSSISPKWVGWFVRTRLRLQTAKSNGVYVIPLLERQRVEMLARRFGIELQSVKTSASLD